MGKQNRNGGSIDRSNVLSAKTVREIMLKGLKRKISDVTAWIDVELHWIQAVQTGSTDGQYGRRWYGTDWFSTGKGTCNAVGRRVKYPFQGFYQTLFYTYPSQKHDCFRSTRSLVLEWLDDSALRGQVASVLPTFN